MAPGLRSGVSQDEDDTSLSIAHIDSLRSRTVVTDNSDRMVDCKFARYGGLLDLSHKNITNIDAILACIATA